MTICCTTRCCPVIDLYPLPVVRGKVLSPTCDTKGFAHALLPQLAYPDDLFHVLNFRIGSDAHATPTNRIIALPKTLCKTGVPISKFLAA